MTDIDNQDDYIKRLGKLVPIYVIALLSVVAAFFDIFYSIDPLQAQIALYIVIGVGVVITFYVETRQRKVTDPKQIALSIINGALWLFLVNMSYFDFALLLELWLKFAIALWTFILGIVTKKS